MTVGIDVEQLFPDMVLCMNTADVELKKLVYLYIINYARASPDNMETALLAVNTFVKDGTGPSPLLRALAVRTMGCLRLTKITEYLLQPLSETLKDHDPYVRKTAALCVAKIYEINPELVEEAGFIGILNELVSDTNPMVVANAVAALTEIQRTTSTAVFALSPAQLHKLLTSLPDCTDWGQVLILDAITKYTPEDYQETETIIDRVVARPAHAPTTPLFASLSHSPCCCRLQHGNCAVVMSALRIILLLLPQARDRDFVKQTIRKLAPPIVTMLSGPKEIQYITLRNVSLIVQKRPKILENQYRVFFCKYNDPLYIKMEKLEVLYKLANERNIEELLNEFKEYATEVDIAFVRKSVNLIGKCAIKLEHSAQKCVDVLVELIKQEVDYVVQECIVVIRDIYRRYPNRYEDILGLICQSLGDTTLEQEAKAAMVWIVGEYADRIDNADEVLDQLRENLKEDPVEVQMALLVATVKLFLKNPEEGPKQLVQEMLTYATKQSLHPDLRMRGYVYWRLLSADPQAARQVILSERPEIGSDPNELEPALMETLMSNIAMLASVYHKPPETFVTKLADIETGAGGGEESESESGDGSEEEGSGGGSEEEGGFVPSSGKIDNAPSFQDAEAEDGLDDEDMLDDLMGLTSGLGGAGQGPKRAAAPPPVSAASEDLGDLLGMGGGMGGGTGGGGGSRLSMPGPLTTVLAADKAGGIHLDALFTRLGQGFAGPGLYMFCRLHNQGSMQVGTMDMMLNKNSFGVKFKAVSHDGVNPSPTGLSPILSGHQLGPGSTAEFVLALDNDGPVMGMTPLMMLQFAMKLDAHPPVYFGTNLPLEAVFREGVECAKTQFMNMWKAVPAENEIVFMLGGGVGTPPEAANKLTNANFLFVHQREEGPTSIIYCATQTTNNLWVLLEMPVNGGRAQCKVRLQNKVLAPFVEETFTRLLTGN